LRAPNRVDAGTRIEIRGRLTSIDPTCGGVRTLILEVVRPSRGTRTTSTDADGRYVFRRTIFRDTVLRVLFAGSPGCEPVRSAKHAIGV
jgi:hypothetical protein